MEPILAETPGARTRLATGEPDRRAVASRRRALERLRNALRDGADGPILITGEPGSGKHGWSAGLWRCCLAEGRRPASS